MDTSERHTKRRAVASATPPAAATVDPGAAVLVGARRVAAAIAEPGAARTRDEWLAVVGDCQSLINTLTAVQDAAIAEAARRESVWCEDGTLGETVHVRGRVTLDAADVVAPVIGATHPQAERRVEQAVRLAAQRVPVPADDRDPPVASGLGGLHDAMTAGQLDAYRAGVVAFELEVAPADVADAIVSALSGHLGDDSSSLRRRTRVLLSRISPDLVRERTERARAETGLRRWVAEPGVDEWHGTFPSEDAASAWAAIDRLAHDLVADGTCTNIEQARGKALTDLVTGNATVDVQIVLTVPADSQPVPGTPEATPAAAEPQAGGEHAPAPTAAAPEPYASATTPQAGGEHALAPTAAASDGPAVVSGDVVALGPRNLGSDTLTSVTGTDARTASVECTDNRVAVTAEAQHTSAIHPGGRSAPAECTDNLGAVQPVHQPPPATGDGHVAGAPPPHPPTTARSDDDVAHAPPPRPPAVIRSDDDLIEVQGSRPSEPLLVRRGWLRDHLMKKPTRTRRPVKREAPRFVPCDPLTGARLDPGDDLATAAYRPGDDLAALVRARDGRCRFPGCSVAARFCDLDHVRPWPLGATTATNLLTLCRRHHRIKQRPGWRLALAPDGVATWTDPTGLVRTTAPLNALHALVLAADLAPAATLPDPRPAVLPAIDQPRSLTATTATPMTGDRPLVPRATTPAWSALETHLTFRAEHHVQHPTGSGRPSHPTHRRCTSVAELRAGLARQRSRSAMPDEPPF